MKIIILKNKENQGNKRKENSRMLRFVLVEVHIQGFNQYHQQFEYKKVKHQILFSLATTGRECWYRLT